jgi:hypothetical protein
VLVRGAMADQRPLAWLTQPGHLHTIRSHPTGRRRWPPCPVVVTVLAAPALGRPWAPPPTRRQSPPNADATSSEAPSVRGPLRGMVFTRTRSVRLPRHAFTVHFGPIASGDEDIVTVERQQELHRRTGALVAAWEGAGGARACQFSARPFVEMRGVTDGVNSSAAADFRANLKTAMENRSYQGLRCRISPDEKIASWRCLCQATRM